MNFQAFSRKQNNYLNNLVEQDELQSNHSSNESPEFEDLRSFNIFKDDEGVGREVVVKTIGNFDQLSEKLELGTEFSQAKRIMAAFNRLRAGQGSDQTDRRPHFLIAGGFVRDTLLNKKPHDIDFATDLPADKARMILQHEFQRELDSGEVSLVETGKQFGVLRLRFRDSGEEYEIATFRVESEYRDQRHPDKVEFIRQPGQDAERRDFTINAMFYDPQSGRVIDYVGGLQDIKKRRLRFVGRAEDRIKEDKLRMLRYVRFLLKTGFSEDAEAIVAIKEHASDLASLDADGVRQELEKMQQTGRFREALERLKQTEILRQILPEVDRTVDCPQGPPYHMEGNVFEHTKLVADNLPKDASFELVMAAYLHDVGKVTTRQETTTADGLKVSFHDHEHESVKMARQRLNALRFSNTSQAEILWLIESHMRAHSFFEMKESKARQLVLHQYGEELIALAVADELGAKPSPGMADKVTAERLANARRVSDIKEYVARHSEALTKSLRLVNGSIIVEKIIELRPDFTAKTQGRIIGKIKDRVLQRLADEMVHEPAKVQKILEEEVVAGVREI